MRYAIQENLVEMDFHYGVLFWLMEKGIGDVEIVPYDDDEPDNGETRPYMDNESDFVENLIGDDLSKRTNPLLFEIIEHFDGHLFADYGYSKYICKESKFKIVEVPEGIPVQLKVREVKREGMSSVFHEYIQEILPPPPPRPKPRIWK